MMIQRYDGPSTATLLPLKLLVEELERAVVECAAAEISEAKRLEIPLVGKALNHSGPASSQEDASHKPVTMCPFDFSRDPATINDEVVVYDAVTGVSLFALDGPTVTGRRTAAITLLAISRSRKTPPKVVAIIGTGKQASTHVQALSSFYPEIELVVAGTSPGEEEQFCARHGSCCVRPFTDRDWSRVDVVVTLTTSKTPVYVEAATQDRLVVGVGAFTPDAAEVGRETVLASTVIVDDPAGARQEAGDLIQAGVDWFGVISLGDVLNGAADVEGPIFFKSVGCPAWDLVACRVARQMIAQNTGG